jgi:hypothetical protein
MGPASHTRNRLPPPRWAMPGWPIRQHRRTAMNRITLTLLLILVLACPAVAASAPGTLATKNWKAMDQCTREARTAFPDFTAESNAKRDAKLKACLEGRNLPPREPLSPAQ